VLLDQTQVVAVISKSSSWFRSPSTSKRVTAISRKAPECLQLSLISPKSCSRSPVDAVFTFQVPRSFKVEKRTYHHMKNSLILKLHNCLIASSIWQISSSLKLDEICFLPQKNRNLKHLSMCLQFISSFIVASIIKFYWMVGFVRTEGFPLRTHKYQDKTIKQKWDRSIELKLSHIYCESVRKSRSNLNK